MSVTHRFEKSLHTLIASTILLGLPAAAQSTAAGASGGGAPSDEEVYQLGEVVVDSQKADKAYRVDQSRTATKTATPLIDIPQSVSVVTRSQIEDQGMLSVSDALRYVPGVGISQGEGNRDTPILRGNSTNADFFIDGIRDDSAYYRDFYNIDRMEVLKGPNAMIFGRGGSGGLINRVLRQADGQAHRELGAQLGSWDQYRGTLDFGDKVNDAFSYRLMGVYEDGDSYRDGVDLQRYGINPVFAYQLGEDSSLHFGYEYFNDERTADRGISSFAGRPLATSASTFFGNPDQSVVKAEMSSAFVTFEHRFSSTLSLTNSARYSAYKKFYQNIFAGATDATGTNVTLQGYNHSTPRDNFFNQTDLVWNFDTGFLSHEFLTGLELGYQDTDNFRNTAYFDTLGVGTTSFLVPVSNPVTGIPANFRQSATDADNHSIARNLGLYVQDQIEITSKWLAVLGVRFDHFEMDFRNNRTGTTLGTVDNLFSPRAGLIFKPRQDLSLYASYSMAFVPRAGAQLSSLTPTNKSFDPEEFENYEVGLKWDASPRLAFTLAAYRLDRTNVIAPDPANPLQDILVDGQRTKGIEFGVTGRVTENWSVSGGYAYQDGEVLATQSATVLAGARLAQLPRNSFSLWNRYDFNKTFGVGLGAIYRDEVYTSTSNKVTLPSFVRFDAAIYYRFNDHFRAQLNVENLFDRDYFASANNDNNITPGSPRAFRLSLAAQF